MNAHTGSNNQLHASPVSGEAPLIVAFTGTGSGHLEGVMQIDFGDGQSDTTIPTIRGFRRMHTYRAAGTYRVELKSGTYGGQHPSVLSTVASVTITVR